MFARDSPEAVAARDGAGAESLGWRQLGRLALRTWPFIRPKWVHVVVLVALGGLSGIFLGVLFFVAHDLFMNKVLVGEKLQPMQAVLFDLDESYVTTGAEDEPPMTREQRRVVRDQLMVWFAIGGVVALGGLLTLPYYGTWIRHHINQNLRVAMIERAEHLSLKYHSHARVGDAVFRVYQDSAMIVNLVEEAIVGPLVMLYALLTGLVFISFFSPQIACACIGVAVPMIWMTVKYTPRIRRRARANRAAASDLTSRLQEVFAAIKVVKANRAERRVLDRFDGDSHRALDAAFHLRLEMVLLSALAMTLGGGLFIAVEFVLAGWVVEERETYLGAMAASFIGFVVWNYGAFTAGRDQLEETFGTGYGLIRVWCMIQDLFIGLERAFFLLDLEPDVFDPEVPADFPTPLRRVVCRDVHFAYDAGAPVLRGVDLVAEAGAVTALVGATGTGKSTLMSMLLRLYDPDQGSVEFNDLDARRLRVEDIRANTAIALQKNVLFAGSVADNIGYAAAGAGRADIEAAARIACADEFITAMDEGFDTELGERGGKLSTGQRQRLSIARAIVRDTPILVLDEPTASLDARTESRLLANLSEWGADKVVFLVTHRLSTIRNANRIAFLEGGRIVELGSHEQLMAIANGSYRAFVEAETVDANAA